MYYMQRWGKNVLTKNIVGGVVFESQSVKVVIIMSSNFLPNFNNNNWSNNWFSALVCYMEISYVVVAAILLMITFVMTS